MTGLSSTSRAQLACAAAFLCVAAVLGWALVHAPLLGLPLAGAGAAMAYAVFNLRRTTASLNKAIAVMEQVAAGNLRARVLGIKGRGNMGVLLRNINRALDQTDAFAKEADAAMRAAAQGRFYRKILPRGLRGDFARYAGDINHTLDLMRVQADQLALFTSRMLQDAVTISVTVNEGALANAEVVGDVRAARDEAQGMAAATEQMVAGINEISSRSDDAAHLSIHAQTLSDEARAVVETAIDEFAAIERAVADAAQRVDSLALASEAIGEIVAAIDGIASQTNLLALNATIEAARAGEAGKGFAVVAGEVKSLSNQTARATEDIGERVAKLRQEMGAIVVTMRRGTEAIASGRTAMQSMGERMGAVSAMVSDTTGRMGEVSRILAQQAAAASQISSGVHKMAALAGRNAVSIEKSSQALTGVEAEIASLLGLLAEQDIPGKMLLLAKADHILWRKHLADAVAGKDAADAGRLADERLCRLGQWVQGPASAPYRGHPAFVALEEPHRRMHRLGIEALRARQSGRPDEAMICVARAGEASVEVLALVDRLLAAPPVLAAVG